MFPANQTLLCPSSFSLLQRDSPETHWSHRLAPVPLIQSRWTITTDRFDNKGYSLVYSRDARYQASARWYSDGRSHERDVLIIRCFPTMNCPWPDWIESMIGELFPWWTRNDQALRNARGFERPPTHREDARGFRFHTGTRAWNKIKRNVHGLNGSNEPTPRCVPQLRIRSRGKHLMTTFELSNFRRPSKAAP